MHKDANLKKQAKVSHLAAISQNDFTLFFSKVCFLIVSQDYYFMLNMKSNLLFSSTYLYINISLTITDSCPNLEKYERLMSPQCPQFSP